MLFSVLIRKTKVPRRNFHPLRSRSWLRGGRSQLAAPQGQVPRSCPAVTAEEARCSGPKWPSDFSGHPNWGMWGGNHVPQTATQADWPPDVKSWLMWRDPDAGKEWRQEEKGMTEGKMVGWHHWLSGHGFEQTSGDRKDRESCGAVHGVAKSWTWLRDWTTKEIDSSIFQNGHVRMLIEDVLQNVRRH